MERQSSVRRVVLKFGTSTLTGGGKGLSQPRMVELARQCAELQRQGYEVVICTSGAVAAGRERLGFPALPPTVRSKQMLAAVGQGRLMLLWQRFFDIYGIHVAQILLTHGDVESRQRFLNAQDTLRALLEQRVLPIINENDAVATEEIKIGDNDNLSALAAVLVDADLLVILTDQPGLFTADPRTDPDARLIPEVTEIGAVRALAGGSRSGLGVGGMATKLQAATVARRAGIDVVIAAGDEPDVILRVVGGAALGTRFPALETSLENRKRWVLAGVVNTGRVLVDAGAAQALTQQGRSLLPAGIRAVEGAFERGDTISIGAEDGRGSAREIARGIVRYPSDDLERIKGCHSDDIAARLGYTYGAAAVHRNDLIVL